MSVQNLLERYQVTPSFALWDGEHAVLRFTGNLNKKFERKDKDGNIHDYLGIEVYLISHSNENYAHREDTTCILRTGKDSTLALWALEELETNDLDLIFHVSNSKTQGYCLRIEGKETKTKKEVKK
jgi:hypothetical protein